MKRRFLVIVHAGDRSLHPQWIAASEVRNWDLVVHYYGDDPQRYPASGDAQVRIDGKGPKWLALHKLLIDTRDAWREYDYIWIPDEQLAANCADINRMFELMAALRIELAQPSLSWDSPVDPVITLHNPNFALRFSSFVEPTAACFSRALLERVLPTFGETASGWGLGHVWPRYLQNPASQCAIFDRIQVRHTRPVGGLNARFSASDAVDPHTEMATLLKKHGVPDAIQLSYGALDRDGRRYNLFDAENGEFVFRLCEGYLGKLADKPTLLGNVFAAHAAARTEYLHPASATASPSATVPAGNALERFKNAVAAASASSAGRVFANVSG